MKDEANGEFDAVELEITQRLDLHLFHPRDVKDLIPEYLEAARRKGLREVRIIHGKGSGTLRRIVHGVLDRLPYVINYTIAPHDLGHWGATVVTLTSYAGDDELPSR